MEWYGYMWLGAVIVLGILEASSVNLVCIWFALGALAALLGTLLGAELWLQIVLFLVVSTAALVATRPLVKRFLGKKGPPTNADRNIGQTAVCTERIENEESRGAARLMGKEWTARTLRGEIVEPGDSVRVEAIEGVKLIVTPIPKTAGTV